MEDNIDIPWDTLIEDLQKVVNDYLETAIVSTEIIEEEDKIKITIGINDRELYIYEISKDTNINYGEIVERITDIIQTFRNNLLSKIENFVVSELKYYNLRIGIDYNIEFEWKEREEQYEPEPTYKYNDLFVNIYIYRESIPIKILTEEIEDLEEEGLYYYKTYILKEDLDKLINYIKKLLYLLI